MVNVKRLRKEKGLTQEALSTAMGYSSPQYISNIERGVSRIPVTKFKVLSRLLGVDVRILIAAEVKRYKNRLMKRYGV